MLNEKLKFREGYGSIVVKVGKAEFVFDGVVMSDDDKTAVLFTRYSNRADCDNDYKYSEEYEKAFIHRLFSLEDFSVNKTRMFFIDDAIKAVFNTVTYLEGRV